MSSLVQDVRFSLRKLRRNLGLTLRFTATGVALGLLLAGALAFPGCRGREAAKPRVVLIGLDGASWKMIEPMARSGELPHFQALMERGASADLASVRPLVSPPVWTSIATSRIPKEHGIDFFYANRYRIKVPTMWERLAASGLRVGLYDYLVTWPPQKLPGGYVVPDWLRRDESVWPPDLFQKIGMPRYAYAVLDVGGPQEVIANSEREVAEKPKVWKRLWEEFHPDVSAVTFYALDVLGHRYWYTVEPRGYDPPVQADPRFAGIMTRTLKAVDGAVGQIVAALGPDDQVVIVSDHGFQPGKRSRRWGFDSAGFLAKAGIDPKRDGVTIISSWFSVSLRVDPGPADKREAVLRKLQAFFDTVRATNGDPVFTQDVIHIPPRPSEVRTRIQVREDMIRNQSPAHAFLMADPIPGMLDRLAAEGTIVIAGEPHPAGRFAAAHDYSGDHDPIGVFIAAGSAIRHRPGRLRLSVLDVAPLVTYLAGQPIPDDYKGQLPRMLIDPEWLEDHPPATIPASKVPRLPDDRRGAAGGDKELEERLRALGYI
jgi:predicted AlkP superfamily phosphohydrolase/phosphomutase